MKPKGRIRIQWSPQFAYVVGLLTTDGSLSKDGRHIIFTSKDADLIKNFQKGLGINCKISMKASGSQKLKKYYFIQVGDVLFYRFLLGLGLTANKTKTLGGLKVPDEYFFDFLRGHFDGDGSFYCYWDPRWKSSYMFYTVFISASKNHINWLQKEISDFLKIQGHITKAANQSIYQLRYAKTDSLKILPKLYYNRDVVCLSRKRIKIEKALKINSR